MILLGSPNSNSPPFLYAHVIVCLIHIIISIYYSTNMPPDAPIFANRRRHIKEPPPQPQNTTMQSLVSLVTQLEHWCTPRFPRRVSPPKDEDQQQPIVPAPATQDPPKPKSKEELEKEAKEKEEEEKAAASRRFTNLLAMDIALKVLRKDSETMQREVRMALDLLHVDMPIQPDLVRGPREVDEMAERVVAVARRALLAFRSNDVEFGVLGGFQEFRVIDIGID
ncbi:hypothetical protein F4777DRAFT_551479 [Nemania sp. FL0916]|nr:hypothetical protein F4777DRAFT_551479 [Nemania sp. FL0916]